jgi:hypothetical protein
MQKMCCSAMNSGMMGGFSFNNFNPMGSYYAFIGGMERCEQTNEDNGAVL